MTPLPGWAELPLPVLLGGDHAHGGVMLRAGVSKGKL